MTVKQTILKNFSIPALFFLLALSTLSQPAFSIEPIFTDRDNLAIRGYDPTAYFSAGKAVLGSSSFSYEHKGAIWHFVNENNRSEFINNIEKYLPQFGGYCAWAVSRGYTASVDPHAWHIDKGKLYLNYSRSVSTIWGLNKNRNIKRAEKNWPLLLAGKEL